MKSAIDGQKKRGRKSLPERELASRNKERETALKCRERRLNEERKNKTGLSPQLDTGLIGYIYIYTIL